MAKPLTLGSPQCLSVSEVMETREANKWEFLNRSRAKGRGEKGVGENSQRTSVLWRAVCFSGYPGEGEICLYKRGQRVSDHITPFLFPLAAS